MNRYKIVALMLFFVFSPVTALDLFKDTKPQSTGKTCQSYAAALALAAKGDPEFPITTFTELRNIEQRFRLYAESYGNALSHKTWNKAMSDLTGGKYTFDRSYNNSNIVGWLSDVKNATSIESETDLLLSQLSGSDFDVILTSVISLDGSDYATGHIVSVLGVIGSGIDSNTKLVAFNSAIKGEHTTGVMCKHDSLPGDEKYSAGIVSSSNFRLKGFPDNYLFMRLVNK